MRKSIVNADKQLAEALEDWKLQTEVRYELAKEAYDFQDDDTKEVIDRIVNRLRLGANGFIRVRLSDQSSVSVKVEQEYLDFNILYVACEIIRDLALFDVRLAHYAFPPSMCISCGAEITGEALPKKPGKHG
jgi:hypothetical protein